MFFLDMKEKHYCTDLISRAYQYAKDPMNKKKYAHSLNNDGFITSVNDILLAKETYLTSYMKVDETTKTVNFYYLEDIT